VLRVALTPNCTSASSSTRTREVLDISLLFLLMFGERNQRKKTDTRTQAPLFILVRVYVVITSTTLSASIKRYSSICQDSKYSLLLVVSLQATKIGTMTSFFAQIMEPGGGIMLLPFVRVVIGCLLALTVTTAIIGVARVHMIILSVLSSGLLASLYFFESEIKRAKRSYGHDEPADDIPNKGSARNKTD
jgi:hypothetical protein